MSLDISDAESSFLHARAEYNTWADKFMARWLKPELVRILAASVADAGIQGMMNNPEAIIKTKMLADRLIGKG